MQKTINVNTAIILRDDSQNIALSGFYIKDLLSKYKLACCLHEKVAKKVRHIYCNKLELKF